MRSNRWIARLFGSLVLLGQFGALAFAHRPAEASSQFDIVGPAGSASFGERVAVLPNGNILIFDSHFNGDVGAVYLYSGATHALISQLTGSQAGDRVGSGGFRQVNSATVLIFSPLWANGFANKAGAVTWLNSATGASGAVGPSNSLVGSHANDQVGGIATSALVLTNGNVVINSSQWQNGGLAQAGAVTWANGYLRLTGPVSTTNSLVGSHASDQVGYSGLAAVGDGNYVVKSSNWDNVGAVTWADGHTGRTGPVSAANSLVGSHAGDVVGQSLVVLANGNYVVDSSNWANDVNAAAGAVTWANGDTGRTGPVSTANSLVGDQPGDSVGSDGIIELTNGNYVVISTQWGSGGAAGQGFGAVTWGSGTAGVIGTVSSANSLVGASSGDQVAFNGISGYVNPLPNGNYVVSSPEWGSSGTLGDGFGAVTWGNGASGIAGVVSGANSLVGDQSGDQVGFNNSGFGSLILLPNGNYLVISSEWRSGGTLGSGLGAVTWGNGAGVTKGTVSSANSLVGSQNGDEVGAGASNDPVALLNNGHVVITSPHWANGFNADAGAATDVAATAPITGLISAANSLVGTQAGDQVGGYGVEALPASPNAAYVVLSPNWANGGAANSGAVTWAHGNLGLTGPVTVTNSLVGDQPNDQVGSNGLTLLASGNFVVSSQHWHGNQGAATWVRGQAGLAGLVSSANSLIGSQPSEQVGSSGITALPNGNFVVNSPFWANGPFTDIGAVTWGNGSTGLTGTVGLANSILGTQAGDRVGSEPSVLVSPPYSDNSYAFISQFVTNSSNSNAGAVTVLPGTGPSTGALTAGNSVRGSAANGGSSLRWQFDCVNQQLVVARPADNIVTLFRGVAVCRYALFLPLIRR